MTGGAEMARLAGRLTGRDRQIARLLREHRVLTTDHIAQLLFGQPSAARRRMLILCRLGFVERFRPWTSSGSALWHYVLGPAGAAILAAETGVTASGTGYQRSRTLAVAVSPQLTHLTGVNSFFASLAAAARRSPDTAELVTWWPEARCAAQWGSYVRPDGYGRWREHDREIDFFLEYDTGTERPASRVTGKLDAYARLADATGIATPVLFWFPGARREENIRRALPSGCAVPAATAYGPLRPGDAGPAEAVWLPAGTAGTRVGLADLAEVWPPARPGRRPGEPVKATGS